MRERAFYSGTFLNNFGEGALSTISFHSSFHREILYNDLISSRALNNFSTEEYVTSSVLGQGVSDSPSLTLVIGAKNV
jgi:hypothetical protein